MARQCTVFSIGSNNNFQFEEGVLAINPHCNVFVFDPTSEPPRVPIPGVTFHKQGLCGKGIKSFELGGTSLSCDTLPNLIAAQNKTLSVIEALKIDIDGGEWDVIKSTDWSKLRVGQLLLEIHVPGGMNARTLIEEYIARIEAGGFTLFLMEAVCHGCPGQLELGFLNRQGLRSGAGARSRHAT